MAVCRLTFHCPPSPSNPVNMQTLVTETNMTPLFDTEELYILQVSSHAPDVVISILTFHRASMLGRALAISLQSVCLSVRHVYCDKTK